MPDWFNRNATSYPSWYDHASAIGDWYSGWHAQVAFIICTVGIVANLVTVLVLARPILRSPVNIFLISMSLCNSYVLVTSLVVLLYNWLVDACDPSTLSYGWAVFMVIHGQTGVIVHTSGVWISVVLSCMRLRIVQSTQTVMARTPSVRRSNGAAEAEHTRTSQRRRPGPSTFHLSNSYAIGCSMAVILIVTITNIPNTLCHTVRVFHIQTWCQKPIPPTMVYAPIISDVGVRHDGLLLKIAFWITGVLYKALPCLLLLITISMLVRILRHARRRRAKLFSTTASTPMVRMNLLNHGDTSAATQALVMIIFIVLITELPQGVMAILSGILDAQFTKLVYIRVGDILDLLSLLNSLTTFIIYVSMSRVFRDEFRDLTRSAIECLMSCTNVLTDMTNRTLMTSGPTTHEERMSTTEQKKSIVQVQLHGRDPTPSLQIMELATAEVVQSPDTNDTKTQLTKKFSYVEFDEMYDSFL